MWPITSPPVSRISLPESGWQISLPFSQSSFLSPVPPALSCFAPGHPALYRPVVLYTVRVSYPCTPDVALLLSAPALQLLPHPSLLRCQQQAQDQPAMQAIYQVSPLDFHVLIPSVLFLHRTWKSRTLSRTYHAVTLQKMVTFGFSVRRHELG